MNVWHDVAASRITAKQFEAFIEIPKGCKAKYELDKETGLLRLDRVLYTSTVYPANYGFIPRTLSDDGDPLDVLVLCSEPLLNQALVRCKPVGVITMEDDGKMDEKIIAIPFGDPSYNAYNSIDELPEHLTDEIRHFFTVYKELEGVRTFVSQSEGTSEAIKIIEKCILAYNHKFN